MEVEMNSRKLVILFIHIQLGLCDFTQPKNGRRLLLSIVYSKTINNFLIYQSILKGFAAYCMI